MAFSLNKAQLIGNVTREPEVRVAGTQKVATIGIATNFSWTDAAGQRKEKAEFHNVVAWRKLAELIEKYVHKGNKIYVEGRMQTREWEGEDGVKRYKTEIVADSIILLGAKGEPTGHYNAQEDAADTTSFQAPREQRSVKQPAAQEAPVEEEVSIDDLPF
ncbi:single-stranded DNA-binding protein [Candidatus Gracilibacteria bacterium]|nr:single-stranded DNA-binding protein [Candidatus Gracilibacteria bacterium]